MSFIWNKDVNEIWYAQAMYMVVHIYNLSMLDEDAGSPAWAIETQFFLQKMLARFEYILSPLKCVSTLDCRVLMLEGEVFKKWPSCERG